MIKTRGLWAKLLTYAAVCSNKQALGKLSIYMYVCKITLVQNFVLKITAKIKYTSFEAGESSGLR